MSRPRPLPLSLEPMETTHNTPISSARFNWARPSRMLKSMSSTDWRRAAIALAMLSTLRFAVHANMSFQDADTDTSMKMYQLARLSLISAGLYAVSSFIEIFGIFACIMKTQHLVRIYLFLSLLAAFLAVIASVSSTTGFFKHKDDLVMECVQMLKTGIDLSEKSTFNHGSWPSTIEKVASKFHPACLSGWTSDAPSKIPTLFFFQIIPSAFVFLFPYLYYRQLIDPHSHITSASAYVPVNAQSARHQQGGSAYSSGSRQSAVSLHRVGQLPGYALSARVGRPSHLAPINVDWERSGSGSPVSPGPPSYNGERRIGYANWFSHGAEYDRLS